MSEFESPHQTVLLVSAQETRQITVDMRLQRWGKPALAALSGITILLAGSLVTLAWHHYSSQANAQQQIGGLREQVTHLQNLTSAEINTKLKALSESERMVQDLQEYLNARGVRVKPVSVEPPSGQPNPAAGGPVVHMRKPVPYTGSFATDTSNLLQAASMVPLGLPHDGAITSRFGYRSNPFTGQGREFHGGLDFRGHIGEPIETTAAGKVTFAGEQSGYGMVVQIAHGYGYETVYGHLSKIEVRKGQSVQAGDVIGKLGNSGRSTGPHLHYEVRHHGERIDPENFLVLTSAVKENLNAKKDKNDVAVP